MEKLLRIFLLFFLLFPLLAAGCLQKPYYPGRDYGELKIRLVLAEEAAVTAPVGTAGTTTAINIEKILIQLSHGKGKLTHAQEIDRKSTRLNSSHVRISYAVFCLKKKKKKKKNKKHKKKKTKKYKKKT